jgi:hypothetical protein
MIDVEMSSSIPNKETITEKDLYMKMKELESELEML